VHRDADGARLVGDGPGDGLADPPRGVGGKLVAATVLEFLTASSPHVAPWMRSRKDRPRLVYFFAMNHEAEIGLHHLGLGPVSLGTWPRSWPPKASSSEA